MEGSGFGAGADFNGAKKDAIDDKAEKDSKNEACLQPLFSSFASI